MKTLTFAFASAMIALSSHVFAGNLESCCCTETKNTNAMASIESVELSTDSGVKIMLQDMTLQAHEQVNETSVEMILQGMTRQIQERVRTPSSNGNTL